MATLIYKEKMLQALWNIELKVIFTIILSCCQQKVISE